VTPQLAAARGEWFAGPADEGCRRQKRLRDSDGFQQGRVDVFVGAGVQTIEVENCVIDQEVAALRFPAPHRIIGKKHDVASIHRNVNDGRVLGDLARSIE